MKRMIMLWGILAWAVTSLAATYYLDPVNGSDLADGSAARPWQSLKKTLDIPVVRTKAAAAEPVTVILKRGYYGKLNFTSVEQSRLQTASAVWKVYKAAPGEEPVFNFMAFDFDAPTTVNMRFVGISIKRSPATGSVAKTAGSAASPPLRLDNVSGLEYINATIHDAGRTAGFGVVYVTYCSNLLFEHCDIGKGVDGMKFLYSQNVDILYNHIHEGISSGISYNKGNRNFLIEGNHIHDFPPYGDSHGSGISFRSGDVTVRGNIIHHGFNSAGLGLFYNTGMSNILVENNLVYDIWGENHSTVFRTGAQGSNVVVRNNTFISSLSGKSTPLYMIYNAALCTGSEVPLYNNLFIGAVKTDPGVAVTNNIMWAHENCSLGGGNTIVYCKSNLSYFDTIFMDPVDLTRKHGRTMDYRLRAGSPAINYGDPSKQPATSLGTLGPDGFIIDNGPARDASHHSAGAYEYNTTRIKDQYPMSNIQFPMSINGRYIYDLTGKQVPDNNRKTGLYLVQEGNSIKKVIHLK